LEDKFYKLFGTKKPIIAMVHLGALPGSPLYNKESGITGLIKEAKKDLEMQLNQIRITTDDLD